MIKLTAKPLHETLSERILNKPLSRADNADVTTLEVTIETELMEPDADVGLKHTCSAHGWIAATQRRQWHRLWHDSEAKARGYIYIYIYIYI